MFSTHRFLIVLLAAACSSPTDANGPRAPRAGDGVILYHRSHNDGPAFEPWSIRPDGSEFQRVDQPFRVSSRLSVDSAGTRLAFTEAGDVVVVSLEEPVAWRTLTNDGKRSRPRLSPNGEWVASVWQAPDGGRDEIRVARTDGSGEITVFAMPPRANSPGILGWFPGSDTLLVNRSDLPGGIRYFAVVRSTGSVRELDDPGLRGNGLAALSPSGRYFAVSDRGPSRSDSARTILIIDRKSRTTGPLLTLPHGANQLAWSPDERYLAHLPFPDATTRIALEVIEVATGQRHVLVDLAGERSLPLDPAWVQRLR